MNFNISYVPLTCVGGSPQRSSSTDAFASACVMISALFFAGSSVAAEDGRNLPLSGGTYAYSEKFCASPLRWQDIPVTDRFTDRIRSIIYNPQPGEPFTFLLVNEESVCVPTGTPAGPVISLECDHGGDSDLEPLSVRVLSETAIEIGGHQFNLCGS